MVLAKLDEVIDIRMPRLQVPQHILAGTDLGIDLDRGNLESRVERVELDPKPETWQKKSITP